MRYSRGLLVASILLASAAITASREAHSAPALWSERGISLGLFAEDPGLDYGYLLREIRATGATHVSVVVPYYQHDVRSTELRAHSRYTPPLDRVLRTLSQARALGLRVLLFPILRLEYEVTPDEWRGALAPQDPDAWWRNYRKLILELAQVAARGGAESFCVGSELSSLDTRPARWAPLIAEVRRTFRGRLVYSANHDHFERVAIWHLVDQVGLSAYFELVGLAERQPSLLRLTHAWRELRSRIGRFWARVRKPIVLTELGYHSQRGTSARPWFESLKEPLGLDEQRDCYAAFRRAFAGAPYLEGVYFWNWFGWGGPQSREYCPRGKPAAREICQAFGVAPARCPSTHGMPWYDPRR